MGEKKTKKKEMKLDDILKQPSINLSDYQKVDPIVYNYIELLGMVEKYMMDNCDASMVIEIVYDYLSKNMKCY